MTVPMPHAESKIENRKSKIGGTHSPRVSVVIPTYNRAETVARAIRSALSQTLQGLEVIVVDDGSTDDTVDVVARFGAAVRYVKQANRGVAAARNRGVEMAWSDYVAFLDSDDEWLPEKLERQMALLEQDPSLGFVYSEAHVVDGAARRVGIKPETRHAETLEELLRGNFVPTLTVVARRERVLAAGGFDTTLSGPEDYDLWMRLAARHPFRDIAEPLALYHQSDGGLSADPTRIYGEYVKIFTKLLSHPDFVAHRALIRERLAASRYLRAKGFYGQRRYAEARREFGAAVKTLPSLGKVFIRSSDRLDGKLAKLVKPYLAVGASLAQQLLRGNANGHRSGHPARVLFIETGTGFGGSSVALVQLLKYLDRSRIEPIVVSYAEGENIEQIRALGVPVRVMTPPDPSRHPWLCRIPSFGFWYRFVPYARRLIRFCREQRIQLIHLNNGILTELPGIAAAWWLRIPSVCYIQGVEAITPIQRVFIPLVSRFVLITQEMRAAYGLERFVPARRVGPVVPHGIEPDGLDGAGDAPATRRALGLSASDRVVTLTARLVPGKGHEDLLQAAPEVLRRVPQAKFLLVGDCPPGQGGGVAEQLKRMAAELGLNGSVIFAGWRQDIPAIMRASDVVTLPSHSEGLGRVLLEAMVCGKPTVGTRVGGIPSVIEEGKTGLLVPPKDPAALAGALVSVLSSRELSRAMGEAGRSRAEQEFSMRVIARRFEAVYNELLKSDSHFAKEGRR